MIWPNNDYTWLSHVDLLYIFVNNSAFNSFLLAWLLLSLVLLLVLVKKRSCFHSHYYFFKIILCSYFIIIMFLFIILYYYHIIIIYYCKLSNLLFFGRFVCRIVHNNPAVASTINASKNFYSSCQAQTILMITTTH